MSAARKLSPTPPVSQVRVVTPKRARLLAEIDAAIERRSRALALAVELVATGSSVVQQADVDDLRAGLEELRRMQGRV